MATQHWLFRPVLLFVSIGSFLLSWVFTCNLLAAMATTGFGMALAFVMATVLEPAKIAFCGLGCANRDLPALIIGIVLTIMSIIGTLGWLTVQQAEKVAIQTTSSSGFKSLQSQAAGLGVQIANLQASANSLPANYYTRKQTLLAEANRLLAQKNELTQQLSNYTGSSEITANALFISLSKFFHLAPSFIELCVNATYGILLELVAVISGVYVFKNSGDFVVNNTHYKIPPQPMFQTQFPETVKGIKMGEIMGLIPEYLDALFQDVNTEETDKLNSIAVTRGNFRKDVKKAAACHSFLRKNLKVIRTDTTGTYKLKSKNEILEGLNS